jgi:hypothetical protein
MWRVEEDIALVKLSHKTQTLIVEAVDGLPDHPVYGVPSKMIAHDMPDYGMMLKSWLEIPMPRVMYMGEDSIRASSTRSCRTSPASADVTQMRDCGGTDRRLWCRARRWSYRGLVGLCGAVFVHRAAVKRDAQISY